MIDKVINAIAEPRRRQMLWLLRERERTAGEIAEAFSEVTRPATSQHLRILEEAGLVSVRKAGTRRYYHLRPEGLADLQEYLAAFWQDRLAALKEVIENESREEDQK